MNRFFGSDRAGEGAALLVSGSVTSRKNVFASVDFLVARGDWRRSRAAWQTPPPMHEYSLVVALLEQVGSHLEGRPSARVRRVTVQVGELSGVVPELLRTAFEVAGDGTPCQGAELVLDLVAARWVCTGCERVFAGGEVLTCEGCGAPARLEAGEELMLMRIELEVPDDV
jgi:hydrogenase nickel incorporation protein HypA/HybF